MKFKHGTGLNGCGECSIISGADQRTLSQQRHQMTSPRVNPVPWKSCVHDKHWKNVDPGVANSFIFDGQDTPFVLNLNDDAHGGTSNSRE